MPSLRPRHPALRGALVAWLAVACAAGSVSRSGRLATATTATGPTTSDPTTTTGPTAPVTSAAPTTPPAAPASLPPANWVAGPWQPAGRSVAGGPAVEITVLQATTNRTVAAARLDTTRLRLALYAGIGQPAGTWSNQAAVPSSMWPGLVATFNSGFKLAASRGGWYLDGRAGVALRDGAASVVIRRDGSATVGQWGRDVTLSPDVVAVRQNLNLLVDAGQPTAGLSTNILPTWGFTLGGVVATWRSAVGVDAAGRLLFVAGPGLDPANLAAAILAAGALRAMELDINPALVSFATFTDGPAGLTGTKLSAAMAQPANRFLTPVDRDFFAAFAR